VIGYHVNFRRAAIVAASCVPDYNLYHQEQMKNKLKPLTIQAGRCRMFSTCASSIIICALLLSITWLFNNINNTVIVVQPHCSGSRIFEERKTRRYDGYRYGYVSNKHSTFCIMLHSKYSFPILKIYGICIL